MSDSAFAPRDQRIVDAEHLRLLALFHFIVAGLALLGLVFLGLHFALFHFIISHGGHLQARGGQAQMPNPALVFAMLRWVYLLFGVILASVAVGNLLSGLFIRGRRHRTFSMVIAGIDCLQIPFGTILGVFTLIVLNRSSVQEAYRAGPADAD